MSYERYKDFRLAPDDNGCWDVLDKDYQQQQTLPSKAAAKRWIDKEVEESQEASISTQLEEILYKLTELTDTEHIKTRQAILQLISTIIDEVIGKQKKYKDGSYTYWAGQDDLRKEQQDTATRLLGKI